MAASLSLSSLFPHSGIKLSSSSASESKPASCPGSTLSSYQSELAPAPVTPSSPPPSPGDHFLLPPVKEQDSPELSHTVSNNLPTILEDEVGNSNKENQNASQTVHHEHIGESFVSRQL